MPEELHELVKRFRGDLSQAEVAARMGKSDGAVAHWESGRTGMASEAVDDFADALELGDTDRRRLHQAATARRRKAASTTAARLTEIERRLEVLEEGLRELLHEIRAGR